MKKIKKCSIKKHILKNGFWTGFLLANKLQPVHMEGCWNLGFKITVRSLEELESISYKFAFYNGNEECGNQVSFYEKNNEKIKE